MTTALGRWINTTLGIAFLLFIVSSPAYANAGLPMLVIVWPLFWLAFIPIVLIEYRILRKTLKTETPRRLIFITTGANLFSTVIGIPIIYFLLLLLEIFIPGGDGTFPYLTEFWRRVLSVTLQAPWLIPYESEFYWMIPVACAFLFIPFYFMSSWIESIIIAYYLRNSYQSRDVKKAVWKANQASYAFLYIIIAGWLIYGISAKWLAQSH